jgi:hypothetical protein
MAMTTLLEAENALVISFLALRKAIGLLGIALPLAVSLGAFIVFQTGLQGSLSDYYYTGTRDVFVGTLWAIGFFLLSYKGYERADAIAGNLGCVFAIGISLFPTVPDVNPSAAAPWIGYAHAGFTVLFFSTLIYFSLCLFTKTDPSKPPTKKKLQRNMVYRVCGYTMAVCILLIGVNYLLKNTGASALQKYHPVFWLEALAIEAFGISWLIKGEAILSDRDNS